MQSKTYHIKTMGCQMNVYDSDQVARQLEGLGYEPVDDENQADCIVVNTCAIREKAEQKVYSYLGRLAKKKRGNPQMVIAVGGCVAQSQGADVLERMPCVDVVFGTHALARVGENIRRAAITGERIVDVHMEKKCDFSGLTTPDRVRSASAFVTIMQGCDNFCSYCVVPYTRGRETSRDPDSVVEEVRALARMGVAEVTLLGQNVNSYGQKEKGPGFVSLLEKVSQVEGISRIRFVTSHPKDLSPRLMEAFGRLDKLCSHIHLPVQSGADEVLKKMNRGYTRDDYLEKIQGLRQACPDIAVSTDFIVGFPGETDAHFQQSLDLIEEVGFDGVFAFKHSERPMAPSRRFKNKVPEEVASRRIEQILDMAKDLTLKQNQEQVGKVRQVLVEGPSRAGGGQLTGRTRQNRIVNFTISGAHAPDPNQWVGKSVSVRIEKAHPHSLSGQAVDPDQDRTQTKEVHHAA